MSEILNKTTGISLGLLMKVVSVVIVGMLIYTQMAIVSSRQQERIDAGIIPKVQELVIKEGINELRFSKIEVQTEDYAENKVIFKQMASDLKEIKDVLIK